MVSKVRRSRGSLHCTAPVAKDRFPAAVQRQAVLSPAAPSSPGAGSADRFPAERRQGAGEQGFSGDYGPGRCSGPWKGSGMVPGLRLVPRESRSGAAAIESVPPG